MVEPPSSLIAVMGCTGAGKSTFIRLVTGCTAIKVGHTLKSTTSDIESYQFSHRGKIITLVDTPGFDDSNVSDREILMKLLEWLRETHENNQKLCGILYLHRIDAPRMQGSSLRNFGIFKHLCGEGFYKNVILGTTCWDLVDTSTIGERREAQLSEKDGFWHALLQNGSEIVRVPKEKDSARDLIFHLASKNSTFPESQPEMGTMDLALDKFSTTRTINQELEELRAENKRIKRVEEESFARLQQQQEEEARQKHEKEKRRYKQTLREQEQERQSALERHHEVQAQRDRQMEELRKQMGSVRIPEGPKSEQKRGKEQKRLDDTQFSLDYKKLCRANKLNLITVTVLSFMKMNYLMNVLICNAMSSPRDSDFAADAGCSQEYIAPEGGHIGCNKRNAVFTGGPQAQGLLVQKPAGLAGRA